MIVTSLPEQGQPFGWSVCATELTAALKRIVDVKEVSPIGDISINFLAPVLHAIQGPNLLPLRPHIKSLTRNVGYAFIEDMALARQYELNLSRHFDHVVTGSTWCTGEMRKLSTVPVSTIIQGINPRFFDVRRRPASADQFVVLSAGKAETRKGQDVVVKATRVLMDRHDDVHLSVAWFNPWRTPGREEIQLELYRDIPRARTRGPGVAMLPYDKMPEFYADADVGFFPNRCEAGNNMPMCELMATGCPVIGSYVTGHRDVLEAEGPLTLLDHGRTPIGGWYEPSLDECVEKLEWAYQHRDTIATLGASDRHRMRKFTWERAAREFLQILEGIL